MYEDCKQRVRCFNHNFFGLVIIIYKTLPVTSSVVSKTIIATIYVNNRR